MLKVDRVVKKWSRFQLGELSFELPAGYIMGLIGLNGAGKTTLIRILAGMYKADRGNISWMGNDYENNEVIVKEDIGVVFQEDIFEEGLSLLQNGERFGKYFNRYEKSLLQQYLERFELDGQRCYKKLSKGEKLKFALAFALSHKPRLLLLDEPTANFDKEFRREFFTILREFTESGENSVILSTHVMTDIDRIADYILFLRKGRQCLYGDIESIRRRYQMVAGEAYKIRLIKDRVIYMEEGELGCKALIRNNGAKVDAALKVWEPSAEELIYFVTKGEGNL